MTRKGGAGLYLRDQDDDLLEIATLGLWRTNERGLTTAKEAKRMKKMNVMTVSPGAQARVRTLLTHAGEGQGLRISVEKGGCAGMSYKMEIAEARKGDDVIEFDGGRVVVDAGAVLYLLGTTMDVKTDQFSSTFVFENPNQTSACGCGESVELKPVDQASVDAALGAAP